MTRHAERLIRDRVLSRLLVTLDSGETFDGLLKDADTETVLLVGCFALAADGGKTPVDGELLLPRIRIAYMQRPPG